jgi:acyl-CoA synthetase (AMP-forming)/AMP-acid ligase II
MFRETVARHPGGEALAHGDVRVTYAALDAAVDAVAGNLAAQGFRKGDRLGLLIGNRLEFVYALLAAARIGVIAVPMNIRQRRPEIDFVLNQCEATGLIYEAHLAEQIPDRAAVPSLRRVFVIDATDDSAFALLMNPARPPACDIAEEDVFCLLYTSGTTGRPKGAMLTHLGTIHSVLHFAHGFALSERDVTILAVPASHVTGVVAVLLSMLRAGGLTVMMSAFRARAFLELAQRERMTAALIVPAMYNLCLLEPGLAQFDLSAWRLGSFGGAAMPEATIAGLARLLPGLTLVNVYGATETTSPATMLPPGEIANHADTVGQALPCADVIVVDDEGRELPPGTSGEIWVAGPIVVPGYWANPDADRDGFTRGFWRSGDIGSIDTQGYVRVFDRKKDMINRAGYKVYCIEVENVLAHHPAVVECAVVGRPDPVLGERVQAFIVAGDPQPTAAALQAYCAERLSDYKVPDIVTFLRDPLPRNANGKILKSVLRQGVGKG